MTFSGFSDRVLVSVSGLGPGWFPGLGALGTSAPIIVPGITFKLRFHEYS